MREQGQHDQHQPERMLEPEQRGACGLRKGLATSVAFVPAFFDRMDANASACATGGVRAYYQLRTHRWKGGIEHTPNLTMRSVLSSRLHALLRRYPSTYWGVNQEGRHPAHHRQGARRAARYHAQPEAGTVRGAAAAQCRAEAGQARAQSHGDAGGAAGAGAGQLGNR
jgi:hypothetical protein